MGTAVSLTPMRVTAPWKCSIPIAVIVDGVVENCSTMASIAASSRPPRNPDFQ